MKLFRLFFLSLILLILPITSYAKSPMALNINQISKEYSNSYISMDIKYPQILSNYSGPVLINSLIKTSVDNFVTSLESDAKASFESSKSGSFDFFPYNGVTSYQVMLNNKNLLSIPITYYEYTGGAHGMTNLIGYNFNPISGKSLSLNDLFKSPDYMPYLKNIITTSIKLDPDIYFNDSVDYINSLKEFKNFYVSDTFLVIFFNQYEIAPYSSGIREFKIPLKSLRIYLYPKYKSL